jgi:cytochrome c553
VSSRGSRRRLLLALAAATAAVVPASALGGTKSVTVTISDSSVKLSSSGAPVGSVAFTVKNTGKRSYVFAINSKKTGTVKPGNTAKLTVSFSKTGKFMWTVSESGSTKKPTGTFTITSPGNPSNGKKLFVSNGCGSCHALKAAGTKGTTGPNLDKSKPTYSKSVDTITNGAPGMPGYKGVLTTAQIQDVAAFIEQST